MYRWTVWNLLFPLHEFAKGHATYRLLREMEAADRLAPSALERYRENRLAELLNYCHTHVPFIRARMDEAGIRPTDIRCLADLTVLRPTTKDDIRAHRADLRSRIARDLVDCATGGSTGAPLIFDLAKRRIAARVACRQRVSRWWGLSVGDPEIALWGSPIELSRQHRIKEIRDRLLATRLLSAFEMNETTVSKYLDILEHGRWRQMFGYPSAVYQLCLQAAIQGRDLRRVGIHAAFVTGEVLLPYQRELITEVLGCPVADGYGGRDSGCVAHECPQGGMHILADCAIVETLDENGQAVPSGEGGEITVTDLYSHEAPFIRYRTGDIGVLSTEKCRCGRSLPLLERIEGRCNDLVVAPDGRTINSLGLIYAVREVPGVEQFRIRQRGHGVFHVQMVRNLQFPFDGETRIRHGWAKLLRAAISVTFEYMDKLPVEASGKFRHVISDIPAGQLPRPSQVAHTG